MNCKLVNIEIEELSLMKKRPKELYYIGNLNLLHKTKVSIVGTRRPCNYTKDFTFKLSQALSKRDVIIVSGAAMGVDAIAHRGAKSENTIAVMANGLNIEYPAVNRALIKDIKQEGLTLSFYPKNFKATKWSFVARNELVVALGDILIVTEADLNSGSLRSVEFAQKMGKKIYVLPHRLGDSLGTNMLLKNNEAKPIYDIEEFANRYGVVKEKKDEFTEFLKSKPTFDEAIFRYGEKIYEAELNGLIAIENGYIITL